MDKRKVREFFEEDLGGISNCTKEDMIILIPASYKGDQGAFQKLVEGCMHHVTEAAAFFDKDSMYYMDLIQEGNLALMMFLKTESEYKEDTEYRMNHAIKDAMMAFIEEEKDAAITKDELVKKLNLIDEICVGITERDGEAPSAESVAELTNMDVSDVRYLMKIALNAINKEN